MIDSGGHVTSQIDVTVREVGPRDGLQSLSAIVPLDTKVRLVRTLSAAGVVRIEAGSFVSPRAVPQMADSADVFGATDDLTGVSIEALVVDRRGALRAVDAGVSCLVVVAAASDRFSMANVKMTTDQAIAEIAAITEIATAHSTRVVADIATAFGCAYQGVVPVDRIADVAASMHTFGVDELTLADTTGMATPPDVGTVVDAVRDRCPDATIGLHFHNTRGLGLANVWAGIEAGVRLFDSSIGGIGGCPFSPGATGNVATEDLVHLLEATGHTTGIDLERLISVGLELERELGIALPGQLLRSRPRWLTKERAS
jgi:hydroxymethylglutaryl-CoA lyase